MPQAHGSTLHSCGQSHHTHCTHARALRALLSDSACLIKDRLLRLPRLRRLQVDLHFKYPMAVAAMGMGFASAACYVYCDVFHQAPPVKGMDHRFYWTRVAPVGACQGEPVQVHAPCIAQRASTALRWPHQATGGLL